MVNQSKFNKVRAVIYSLFLFVLMPNFAHAGLITYQMDLDGAQEVGIGDPDGSAIGTISFDDVTGLVSWDLFFTNVDDPVAMHIHGPSGVAGLNTGVFIGLGVNTTGGVNTLINSLTMDLNDMMQITNNPSGFYINVHTQTFPGGAVRGQLGNTQVPVPATMSLILMAGLFLFRQRL